MPNTLGKTLSSALRAYYLGPEHPMKLRFWWWFRKRLNYARLTIPYGEGGWITVDERDVVSGFVFVEGAYEPEVWDALARYARADEVVWDVGGNIGTVAIRAVLDPRVRVVHAFEPDPVNAEVLEHNLGLNGDGFVVHRVALDSASEVRHLHLAPSANRGLSSLALATSTGKTVEVECRPADELVFDLGVEAPTLMKVDVEDWELHVLRGARRLLAEKPPRAIIFEAASDGRGEIVEREIVELLEGVGYRVERLLRPDGAVESRENYLAVHGSVAPQGA